MNKLWIKLTRDYAGYKNGERVEVEETIARAYITAGVAVEDKQAEDDILAVARAEVDRALGELRQTAAAQQQEVARALISARDALRPKPMAADESIVATDSEDDKLLRSGGGFRSLGHFAHAVMRAHNPSAPDTRCVELCRDYQGLLDRVHATANAQARALGSGEGPRNPTGRRRSISLRRGWATTTSRRPARRSRSLSRGDCTRQHRRTRLLASRGRR